MNPGVVQGAPELVLRGGLGALGWSLGSSGVGAPEWSWERSWTWVRPDLPRVVLGVSWCSLPPFQKNVFCSIVFNLSFVIYLCYLLPNIAFCN